MLIGLLNRRGVVEVVEQRFPALGGGNRGENATEPTSQCCEKKPGVPIRKGSGVLGSGPPQAGFVYAWERRPEKQAMSSARLFISA